MTAAMIAARVLEALAILLVTGAFYYRVWREWIQHGLSGTSYMSLGLVTVGSLIGLGAATFAHGWAGLIPGLIYFGSACTSFALAAWKIHARVTVLLRRPHGPHGHR